MWGLLKRETELLFLSMYYNFFEPSFIEAIWSHIDTSKQQSDFCDHYLNLLTQIY